MSSPNTIKLYNKGANSLTIDISGNVGIGKTNPNCRLDNTFQQMQGIM